MNTELIEEFEADKTQVTYTEWLETQLLDARREQGTMFLVAMKYKGVLTRALSHILKDRIVEAQETIEVALADPKEDTTKTPNGV